MTYANNKEALLLEFNTLVDDLNKYQGKRIADARYILKDRFRQNIFDPNSLNNRLNAVEFIMAMLHENIRALENIKTEEFSVILVENLVSIIKFISEKIEVISDAKSELKKILTAHQEAIFFHVSHLVTNPEVNARLNSIQQAHLNQLEANKLIAFQIKRFHGFSFSPRILFLRIKDKIFPKTRDARKQATAKFVMQLKNCYTTDDYITFFTDASAYIKQHLSSGSALRSSLIEVQKSILTKIDEGKLVGFSADQFEKMIKLFNEHSLYKKSPNKTNTITPLMLSNISEQKDNLFNEVTVETQIDQGKIEYFRKTLQERFIYRVIGHGVTQSGVVARATGLLGKISSLITSISPGFTGGNILANTVAVTMQMVEEKQQVARDKIVTSIISYHLVNKIAEVISAKVTRRYSPQILALYHTDLYQNGIDSLVFKAIDNMINNLEQKKSIQLTEEQSIMLAQFTHLKQMQESILDEKQQQQLELLQIEILSDHVIDGINKNLTRLPFAGLFPTTHLMHKDDNNSVLGGKRFNVYGIIEKPGFAVKTNEGVIKLYNASGLKPDKYGFVLLTEGELEKVKNQLPLAEVTNARKYDKEIQLYQMFYKLLAEPGQKLLSTQPASPISIISKELSPIDILANSLISIFKSLLQIESALLPPDDLIKRRKEINQIKHEIKSKKIGDNAIYLSPGNENSKISLDALRREVDKKLQAIESSNIASYLNVNSSASVKKSTQRKSVISLVKEKFMPSNGENNPRNKKISNN